MSRNEFFFQWNNDSWAKGQKTSFHHMLPTKSWHRKIHQFNNAGLSLVHWCGCCELLTEECGEEGCTEMGTGRCGGSIFYKLAIPVPIYVYWQGRHWVFPLVLVVPGRHGWHPRRRDEMWLSDIWLGHDIPAWSLVCSNFKLLWCACFSSICLRVFRLNLYRENVERFPNSLRLAKTRDVSHLLR